MKKHEQIKPSEKIVNEDWLRKSLWDNYRLPKKVIDELIPMFFKYWRESGQI